jgi:hypothetical protein
VTKCAPWLKATTAGKAWYFFGPLKFCSVWWKGSLYQTECLVKWFVLIRKICAHFKGFNISQKPKSSPLSYFAQKTSLNLAPNWYPIIFTCWSCRKDPLKFLFLCEFK